VREHPGAGHGGKSSRPDPESHDPQPPVERLLLDRIDDLVRVVGQSLDHIRTFTERLHPERARSCRNATTVASVMVDEIRWRAHARPLDEAGPC
jgi:hypothetical protein